MAPLVTAIREPQGGGSQAFVSDLARGLVSRGHEVHVYAATGSEIPGVTVIDTGVDPRSLAATWYRAAGSPGRDPAAAGPAFASAYSAVRRIRYDVIHNQAGTWRGVARVDAVLPPYVPTRSVPWSDAAGDGAIFAGRLSPEKGAAEAIDIAQAAGARIDVYGDVYDAEYARERIDPRRDAPEVTVHPGVPRTSMWAAMGRAAVVVCPARWDEPFGMAAADAQACGTPVVAFNRGGLGEIVVDGVTGFLVAPDDIGAAADSVRKATQLSRSACREHAERHLDLEWSLDAHEQLYRRVIGLAGGSPVT